MLACGSVKWETNLDSFEKKTVFGLDLCGHSVVNGTCLEEERRERKSVMVLYSFNF